jgi:hypothetical protein
MTHLGHGPAQSISAHVIIVRGRSAALVMWKSGRTALYEFAPLLCSAFMRWSGFGGTRSRSSATDGATAARAGDVCAGCSALQLVRLLYRR